jgi:hypothetical protein
MDLLWLNGMTFEVNALGDILYEICLSDHGLNKIARRRKILEVTLPVTNSRLPLDKIELLFYINHETIAMP